MNRNYIGSLVGSFSCSIVLEQHAVIAERRGFKSGCDNIDLICSDAFLTTHPKCVTWKKERHFMLFTNIQ